MEYRNDNSEQNMTNAMKKTGEKRDGLQSRNQRH